MKFKKEKIGEDNDFFSMALDAAVQETQDHKKKKKTPSSQNCLSLPTFIQWAPPIPPHSNFGPPLETFIDLQCHLCSSLPKLVVTATDPTGCAINKLIKLAFSLSHNHDFDNIGRKEVSRIEG